MRVPIPKALTFAFILLAFFALANALPSFLTSYSRHSGIENAEEISTSGIRGRAIEAISRISPDNTCGKMTSNRRGYACDAIKNAGPCCSGNGWCGVGDGMSFLSLYSHWSWFRGRECVVGDRGDGVYLSSDLDSGTMLSIWSQERPYPSTFLLNLSSSHPARREQTPKDWKISILTIFQKQTTAAQHANPNSELAQISPYPPHHQQQQTTSSADPKTEIKSAPVVNVVVRYISFPSPHISQRKIQRGKVRNISEIENTYTPTF